MRTGVWPHRSLLGSAPRARANAPQLEALGLCAGRQARRSRRRTRCARSCLACINTYKDGCSASEARQAVGGGRGAVVTGTYLAEAIHRLALWVGGLSTAGAICTLRRSTSVHAGHDGGPATPTATEFTGGVQMNHEGKPMALASLPDNWSAFNAREVLPWQVSRADAAAILRRARSLRARGQARISFESVGRYRLSTFNTLILQTRRC